MKTQLEKFNSFQAEELTPLECQLIEGGANWWEPIKAVVEGVKAGYDFVKEVGGDIYRSFHKKEMRCQ